nr:hypothetical protein [Tanacetum cinerariifolium]
MLIVVPFHNLELGDSDDPLLGVYIESRFSVNCEPIELLTFPPLVRNSPKGVPVVVYWLLTSPKILEVVVDEMFKQNYTTTLAFRYQRKRLQQITWILLTFGVDLIQLIRSRFVDFLQMIFKLTKAIT